MVRRRERTIEVENGIVECKEEIGYPVVEYVFEGVKELTEVFGNYSRIIPPKYVVHWTTIIVMSGADDVGFDEMEERVDRYVDNGQGGSG